MSPFLFLPGPQVYNGEHGQGAKNSEGQNVFKRPLLESARPAKADLRTRECPARPPTSVLSTNVLSG